MWPLQPEGLLEARRAGRSSLGQRASDPDCRGLQERTWGCSGYRCTERGRGPQAALPPHTEQGSPYLFMGFDIIIKLEFVAF